MNKKKKEAEKRDFKQIESELIKKFNVDIVALKREQLKLAKLVSLKDAVDFSVVDRMGGCCSSYAGNHIVVGIVVLNQEMEIIEQEYFLEKLKFPYLSEFRAYREVPSMLSCFKKLDEVPDVVFIEGHGIAHPRGLGIASHFGLSAQVPTIGIAKHILCGELKNGKIILNGKEVGAEVLTRKGSKPIYVSPGHMVSLKSAIELTKKFLREPHKLPEPLALAHKYSKKMKGELASKNHF